jgi:membrane protein YqaA with SNARE-associated domain
MSEWLKNLVFQLHGFIVTVPIYYAAPAMVFIGALDSSLLSLPEINDYLVVARCYSDPKSVFYFPLFAALGSVIGCNILYAITSRGGKALLTRRFKPEHLARVESAYARFGVLALAIPALLPPPMPFKIFVATAGALRFPRWKFRLTIMIARSARYIIEGALAVFYGEIVIEFMKIYGPRIVAVVLSLAIAGVVGYLLWRRRGANW